MGGLSAARLARSPTVSLTRHVVGLWQMRTAEAAGSGSDHEVAPHVKLLMQRVEVLEQLVHARDARLRAIQGLGPDPTTRGGTAGRQTPRTPKRAVPLWEVEGDATAASATVDDEANDGASHTGAEVEAANGVADGIARSLRRQQELHLEDEVRFPSDLPSGSHLTLCA